MKIKSFVVESKAGDRVRKSISELVDETVNKFISGAGVELIDVSSQIEFSQGTLGKAFLTISYNPKEEKKEVKK